MLGVIEGAIGINRLPLCYFIGLIFNQLHYFNQNKFAGLKCVHVLRANKLKHQAMATITQTKKQIEKALKQLLSIKDIQGRVDFTYDLPEGQTMIARMEAWDSMIESIKVDGLNRFNHIFSKKGLEIYICSK